nr:tetratricopeptide repeat protein [Candidatus Sigynarchaeum springense]
MNLDEVKILLHVLRNSRTELVEYKIPVKKYATLREVLPEIGAPFDILPENVMLRANEEEEVFSGDYLQMTIGQIARGWGTSFQIYDRRDFAADHYWISPEYKFRPIWDEAYRKALATDSKEDREGNKIAQERMKKGDIEGAIEAYKRVLSIHPDNANALNGIGIAHAMMKDYPAAIKYYEQVISLIPDDPSPWINKGNANLNQNRFEDAMTDYNRAIELNPKDVDVWNSLGNARFKANDIRGAIEAYEKATALNANFSIAWRNLAIARNRLKDHAGAIEACEKLIDINPRDIDAWDMLGDARKKAGDLGGALAAYRRELDLDSNIGWAYVNIANILGDQGDKAGAIAVLHQMLEKKLPAGQDDAIGVAHFNIACFYAQLGKVREALEYLKQAITKDPEKFKKYAQEDESFTCMRDMQEFIDLIR